MLRSARNLFAGTIAVWAVAQAVVWFLTPALPLLFALLGIAVIGNVLLSRRSRW